MLRNRLICGYCGSPMSAETGTARNGELKRYYKCYGKKRNNGCKKSQIRKELLEQLVVDTTLEVINENTISSKNKSKKNIKKKKKHPIRNFFIFIFLIILIIGIIFYKKVQENGGGIQGILCTILGQSVEDLDNLEPIEVLLLGISEDLDSKLTDTIIVGSYNPQEQSINMLSIPRDTFVGKNKNTAKGSDKINSLYSRKGINSLLETVNKITNNDIKYYAVINNQALINLVDTIGGVNFDVPIDMNYDDPTQNLHIHLKKGYQLIDGEKAEQLLRFRHNNDGTSYPSNYGDNDFGRMKTQRDFIEETVKQTMDIKNILKSKKIIDAVFNNIETNIDKNDLIPYIPKLVEIDTQNITSTQLPGKSDKYNDLWFFIYDKKNKK